MAEGRGQRAEGRGQRAEGRGQRAEGRGHPSTSRRASGVDLRMGINPNTPNPKADTHVLNLNINFYLDINLNLNYYGALPLVRNRPYVREISR
ncbi:MAG TPA: hypothetical protein VLH37_00280 [Bacteroidales bacterium]|nr:hypothetical protein [Bacteroidales bacterium]